MLKHARAFKREGRSDLQIASENGCWRLGGRWAARLVRPPWADLENIFLPAPKMLKNQSCFASEGQSDLRFASEN